MRPYLDLGLSPTVVERRSLFPVHFLCKLDCSCTKSGLWKQGVAVHSGCLDQVLLHQMRAMILECNFPLRPTGGDPGLDHLQKYIFDSLCFLEWTWPFF